VLLTGREEQVNATSPGYYTKGSYTRSISRYKGDRRLEGLTVRYADGALG